MNLQDSRPSRIARGGKAIYGAPLGILMLEARFPRIPGDMGNAGTWPFPVLYRVVRGASPERVVLQGARGLLPDFIAAAQDLVALVLLCHLLLGRIRCFCRQQGQRGRRWTRPTVRRRRMLAIECGTWRSGRTGTARLEAFG
ncbi:aspartate/glutamate racemase family protein [Roseicella aerolata]|uniref:Uncharacterized protein n=1 Tax=Roseicella aerolata TaxID=2883479 RepID=A0A9X1II63_9PROT|nr:hypothetical protein [Roseicella aerolata]MCB4824611.1 hypothetical protein [Roseicella aerolata]